MNKEKFDQENFHEAGFAVIENFYNYETEVLPIIKGISDIIEQVAKHKKINLIEKGEIANLKVNIMSLIAEDRLLGAVIYDAVKQIPEFLALVANIKNKKILEKIHPSIQLGVAAAGYGIRMDLPNEEKFRTFWHQEFPAQLRSSKGVVFWTPLLEITEKLGPVEICKGSHSEGYREVFNEKASEKTGAYSLRLKNEESIIKQFDQVAPLTKPGDLILMDYYTLHQSGRNTTDYPRWSIQFRYFDFDNPFGRKTNWKGSFAEGIDFEKVLQSSGS